MARLWPDLGQLSVAAQRAAPAHDPAVQTRQSRSYCDQAIVPRKSASSRSISSKSGMASVVANGGTAIAITGREGMTGASVIMENDNRVPHETHMQIAGSGQWAAYLDSATSPSG
jgi:N-acetylglutamate synthase/N-acetylornithine aminotransferase